MDRNYDRPNRGERREDFGDDDRGFGREPMRGSAYDRGGYERGPMSGRNDPGGRGRRDDESDRGGFFPGGSERDYEQYRAYTGRGDRGGARDYDRGGEDRYVSSRNYDRGVSYSGGEYGEDDLSYDRGGSGRRDYRRDFDRGMDRGTGRGSFGGQGNYGYESSYGAGGTAQAGYGRLGGGDGGERGYGQRYENQGQGAADRGYGGRDQGYSYRDESYGAGRYGMGEHAGRGPQGYQRSKERISEDVCERLTRHGDIDATNIRVSVDNSEVTLEGTVDSRWAKRMAEDAAESVEGVRDVHNRLRVSQEEGQGRTSGATTGRQSTGQTTGQQNTGQQASGQQSSRTTASRSGTTGSTARSGTSGSTSSKKGTTGSGASGGSESGGTSS